MQLASIAIASAAPAPARRHFWTAREVGIVRQHYPVGGLAACQPLLPGRSDGAIYQQAAKLGLASPAGEFDRRRWDSNDIIDQMIRAAYQQTPAKGALAAFARRVGRPRWWVSKRAAVLGLVAPRMKDPPWTEAETDIITANPELKPTTLKRRLAAKGFDRTETAIVVKLKRLGVSRAGGDDHMTANQLAQMMGVDGKTVTRWIALGVLQAKRRGTERTAAQGGDQHWIGRDDVRRFVVQHPAYVDLRKVDKFWFIEMLGRSYT